MGGKRAAFATNRLWGIVAIPWMEPASINPQRSGLGGCTIDALHRCEESMADPGLGDPGSQTPFGNQDPETPFRRTRERLSILPGQTLRNGVSRSGVPKRSLGTRGATRAPPRRELKAVFLLAASAHAGTIE